ncbi:TAP-like protein [compost metagenome]
MPTAAEIGKAGPLRMLQSRYDSAAPIEGAQKTWDALPQARMIVVEDEYQHSIFPYGTACVDEKIARCFLHGQLPERISNCAGKALGAQDDEDDDDA